METNYCMRCGARLGIREHPTDGPVPYCAGCGDYRYPVFSTAISLVVTDADETHMILIRQYGEAEEVLVAGYVDKGETAEQAARRELREELGLDAQTLRYLGSHYYAPSETLMLNFHTITAQTEPNPNGEVDSWRWCAVEEAGRAVHPGGLADTLLRDYFENAGKQKSK